VNVVAGEPITYIADGHGTVVVVRSFVQDSREVFPPGFEHEGGGQQLWLTTDRLYATLISEDGEGMGWIRGHHCDNSEEVAALLAAYKLTRSAA
jgi:hypothetical protein